tara:strand:+ start:41 stop:481 length:441 start_codon:yes stop_codon:yes gene_type:complete
MTKDNFDRKKNYSNTKIIQLDPLAERLSSIGLKGGAGRSLLSRGVKKTTKDTIKNFKKTDKLSKQKDKLNDSGKFVKDGALANKNIKLKDLRKLALASSLKARISDKQKYDSNRASFSKDVKNRERAQKDLDSYTGKIESKYIKKN